MNAPDATPVALDTWLRREAYTFFSSLSDPFYSVTVTVDVTALHTHTKRHGLSMGFRSSRKESRKNFNTMLTFTLYIVPV